MEPDPTLPATGRVRWGLPDAGLAWLAGIIVSLLAVTPFVDDDGTIPDRLEVEATLVLLAVQNAAVIGYLVYASVSKGLGNLTADFGLRVRARDLGWLAAGVGLAIVAGWLLLPVTELAGLEDSTQEVVRTFEDTANVAEQVLFVVGVVVVAPIGEELLFRGALLRGLMRRTTPEIAVLLSAFVFALVHLAGDPGTGYYVPALFLLGLVSGWRAARTGSLSQSIFLHCGFNLFAAALILG